MSRTLASICDLRVRPYLGQ
ncbi:hypothetical protein F383_38644 [Gossypium arboreum]|uniref:Uncharacterized protein n=1 Tax=Gossypium arboreum TaxID=29729 RepID=A0A0B0MGG7_GOSAR|nr:hypothetical protein F383_38644 [Gossypium arboreum]